MKTARPDVWLRGPIYGIPALLVPIVQALLQAREDARGAAGGLTREQFHARPAGVASPAFSACASLSVRKDWKLTISPALRCTQWLGSPEDPAGRQITPSQCGCAAAKSATAARAPASSRPGGLV